MSQANPTDLIQMSVPYLRETCETLDETTLEKMLILETKGKARKSLLQKISYELRLREYGKRKVHCTECNGTGITLLFPYAVDDDRVGTCVLCDGQGQVTSVRERR